MAELQAETDIMEAPVVAASENKADPKEPSIGGS
jgi:hypothetical protein